IGRFRSLHGHQRGQVHSPFLISDSLLMPLPMNTEVDHATPRGCWGRRRPTPLNCPHYCMVGWRQRHVSGGSALEEVLGAGRNSGHCLAG
ncbi:hypothetical protein E2562_030717, partial [Oryza meyeriana var. granulata]